MPVIYVDVVWLVNFFMDAAILAVTGWIVKRPLRFHRLALGALVGSLYALALFVPSLAMLTTWPGKAVVSLIMVALAIPWRSWLELARSAVLFYFVAFVFAGAAIALHYAVPGVSVGKGIVVTGNRIVFFTSLPTVALMAALPLGFGMIRHVYSRIRRMRVLEGSLYTVFATVGERTVRFTGLLDTGNLLRDPVSRRPVCLVDAAVLAPLLPDAVQRSIEQGSDWIEALEQVADPAWQRRFSLVPYRGAGETLQVTLAVRPDRLEVVYAGRRTTVGTRCLLALHRRPLSTEERFQAILHTEVITEVEGFENVGRNSQPESETADPVATVLDSDSPAPGGRS